MASINTILPFVRAQLPGIPEPILNDAVIRKFREFYWRSEAWKVETDSLLDWAASTAFPTITAGSHIPSKTVVKRIDAVRYASDGVNADQDVPFKTKDELDREWTGWLTDTGSTPAYWTYFEPGSPRIVPFAAATVSTSLQVRVVIAPQFTFVAGDTLDDFLYYEHEEAIRAGIIAELAAMPGKDWSNPALTQAYKPIWEDGITMAKSRSEAGFGQPRDTMSYGGI